MKLVSVAEMQAIEQEANAGGLSFDRMMENAGTGLARVVEQVFGAEEDLSVLGLIGSGNNGGDTLVALAYLAERGWTASAYLVRPRPAEDKLVERLRQAGGLLDRAEQDPELEQLARLITRHRVLLDGVLGTGFQLPLRGRIAEVLDKTRQVVQNSGLPIRVVAVDCPSGVDCESGEAAPEALPAELTVTMAAVKAGLLKFPANDLVGELCVVGIGLDEAGESQSWSSIKREVADSQTVRRMLPERPRNAHKGTFGTALLVAGSINYTGAVLLAGKAAYLSGAGLVTAAIPEPLHAALSGQFPEATWLLLPDEIGVISAEAVDILLENLGRATAILIGPGFGTEETTKTFLARLVAAAGAPSRRALIGFLPPSPGQPEKARASLPPLVIDADGLKLLQRLAGWEKTIPAPAVLTPHPGEMSILTGLPVQEIQADRTGIAERFAREWGHVVVLKGAHTVVSAPDGRTTLIPIATAALARAGSGDVLAGIILGLRAQGMEAYEAAVSGAWIHGQCGLRAAQRKGTTASVLASDLLAEIAPVLSELA